jgi:hypothetical protein
MTKVSAPLDVSPVVSIDNHTAVVIEKEELNSV